ncbi:MAG: glucokinase [Novosphingobium sp.]|jgi:glucokinase|nr:glucokinase [Novosphingobium sp.]
MELVAVDIGGTHVRFAVATLTAQGTVTLGETLTLRTADHTTFLAAWHAFARRYGGRLPRAVALSVAAPVAGAEIRLVNNPWTIPRATIAAQIGVDHILILNDFAAVGHAVANLPEDCFAHVCGPDRPLPVAGTISILGPGTGLGIAHVWRDEAGYRVQATEGGHFSFAPIDPCDDRLLARLRQRHARVSAERVAAGPGIVDIHAVLAGEHGHDAPACDDRTIWQQGISRREPLAAEAVERFCRQLGAIAGDVTLVQGGSACVIAGGLGLRLRDVLPESGFGRYFRAKGRFTGTMAAMPVKLIVHPQPGLFGAAAAFAGEYAA